MGLFPEDSLSMPKGTNPDNPCGIPSHFFQASGSNGCSRISEHLIRSSGAMQVCSHAGNVGPCRVQDRPGLIQGHAQRMNRESPAAATERCRLCVAQPALALLAVSSV